jgi:hypothetical protein
MEPMDTALSACTREPVHMRFARISVLSVITALTAASAAHAQVLTDPGLGGDAVGPCGTATNGPDAGLTGVTNSNCVAGGLVFNGPSIGRIATVIGPTIISPGFAGVVGVTTGGLYMGPGAGSVVP